MIQVFQAQFPSQITPIIDQQGTITTPWMAFLRAMFGRTGQGTGLQNQVNLTATGDITADWNIVAASPANLPALTGGQLIVIQNKSGGNVTVNPPVGATIDGGATYLLADTKMQIFWFFSATQIFSTQLG